MRRRADLIAEHAPLGAHRDLEALFDALPHSGLTRHARWRRRRAPVGEPRLHCARVGRTGPATGWHWPGNGMAQARGWGAFLLLAESDVLDAQGRLGVAAELRAPDGRAGLAGHFARVAVPKVGKTDGQDSGGCTMQRSRSSDGLSARLAVHARSSRKGGRVQCSAESVGTGPRTCRYRRRAERAASTLQSPGHDTAGTPPPSCRRTCRTPPTPAPQSAHAAPSAGCELPSNRVLSSQAEPERGGRC